MFAAVSCFWLQCSSGDSIDGQERLASMAAVSNEYHGLTDASAVDGMWKPDTATEQQGGVQKGRYLPQEGSAITYQLQWSWLGARWDDAARVYTFQNNLGYTLGIQVGYVGLGAMQLVHCDVGEGTSRWGWLFFPEIPLRWQLRTAHADHGFSNDSSFVSSFVAETMMESKRMMYTQGKASGQVYCRLHVLYVPVSQKARDGFELKRRSVWLQGWYQRPGHVEKIPWQVDLHLQSGGVVDLQYATEATTKPNSTQEVLVIRYPVRAFDGIAPDTLHSLDAAHQFLLQLAQTTQAMVLSQSP